MSNGNTYVQHNTGRNNTKQLTFHLPQHLNIYAVSLVAEGGKFHYLNLIYAATPELALDDVIAAYPHAKNGTVGCIDITAPNSVYSRYI